MSGFWPTCGDCAAIYQLEPDALNIGRKAFACRRRPPNVSAVPVQTPGGVSMQVMAVDPPVLRERGACLEFVPEVSWKLAGS